MKAKEYAEKYISLFKNCSNDEEKKTVISDLFKEFMKDIDKLKNDRHITTKSGLIGLLNEGSDKWKSLCRLLPGKELKEIGFRDFWSDKCPEIFKELR